MDNRENQTLQIEKEIGLLELFGEKTLDELLAAISKVTGLGIVISDYTGKPISEMVNFTHFCQKMRTSNSCQLSDASGIAQAMAMQKHFIYCCPCGLLEVVIPIIIDHRFLGGFLAGQVRCSNIPESVPHMQVLSDSKKRMEEPLYKEAYDEIPFYDFKTFCDISELIYHIVTLLGEKSMANIRNFQVEKDELLEQNRRLRLETHSLQSKVNALLHQYDPLFLYNILTDISNMAYLEDAQDTCEMINHLAVYMRGQAGDTVTVGEEADHLKSYLEIFHIKYGKTFRYGINMEKQIQSKRIPTNLIIPFLKREIGRLLEHERMELELKVEFRQEDSDIAVGLSIQPDQTTESANLWEAHLHERKAFLHRHLSKEVRELIKRLEAMYGEAFGCSAKGRGNVLTQVLLKLPGI